MSEKPVASIKTLARYEPDTVYIGTGEYVAECVRADDGDYYLAADVDAAIEALLAERDASEVENERLHEQLRLATVDQATAEAEASDAHAENERLRAENERLLEELDALAAKVASYERAERDINEALNMGNGRYLP